MPGFEPADNLRSERGLAPTLRNLCVLTRVEFEHARLLPNGDTYVPKHREAWQVAAGCDSGQISDKEA